MITVKEKTTIASISDLKIHSEDILKHLEDHQVVLQKHNKPVAVMLNFKMYEQLMAKLDAIEDRCLGLIAAERDSKAKPGDFISLEDW